MRQVYKVPITSWTDVKLILRQLNLATNKEKYKNIVFDTLNEAWDLCTEFICQQHGVPKLKDIPYGQGYKELDAEFEGTIHEIINLGYGLIATCHTKEKILTDKNGEEYSCIAPDLDKRCLPLINGLVDLIGMIGKTWNEEENRWDRWLYTQSTPTIVAGSRNPYLKNKIPFGYKYLEEALAEAFTEAEKEGALLSENTAPIIITEELSFEEIRDEAKTLWTKLVTANEENSVRITKRVEKVFGQPLKLSEITEDQRDLFYLVLLDMRDLAKDL